MAGVHSKGYPLHRIDSSIAVRDKELLSTVEQSVGMITIERSINGEFTREVATGFLVGNDYLLTAYHTLQNKIDDIIQDIARFMPDDIARFMPDDLAQFMPDEEKWERWLQTHSFGEVDHLKVDAVTAFIDKEKSVSFQNFTSTMDDKDSVKFNIRLKDKWDQCYVAFPKASSPHQPSEEMTFSFDQCIPFADKESDVLILKISEKPDCTLPNSLMLQEKYEKLDKVSLYAYLNHEGKEELYLDIQCSVYIDASKLENDLAKAQQFWENIERETNTYNLAKMNITEDFFAMFNKDNGRIIMHTSEKLVQGTSGSPMVFLKRVGDSRQPVVTGMYQRGFPSFYHEFDESIRKHRPLASEKTHNNKFRDFLMEKAAAKANHMFELGVTMEHIANMLKTSQNPYFLSLRNSIFGTERPEVRTYYVYLEELPRLQYIVKRSQDYLHKVSLLPAHVSDICNAVPVPGLLQNQQIKIYFQRLPNDELIFADLSEYDIDSQSRTKSHNKGNLYSMLMLASKTERFVGTELKLSRENKTRLIDFAAETLYKYVEAINTKLEKIKPEQAPVRKLISMGDSILQRRKKADSIRTRPTTVETIYKKLKKLQSKDIIGVGQAIHGIDVLVLEKEKSQLEKATLEKAILDIETLDASETNVIWLPELPFEPYTKPGDKLVPESNLQEFMKIGEGFGSIGVFGCTDKNIFVFTTVGHNVPNGENEKVYVLQEPQENRAVYSNKTPVSKVPIGKCLIHLGSGLGKDADFAVIAVAEGKEMTCSSFIHPTEFDTPPPIRLYKGKGGDLLEKTVQTIRADTDITEGKVKYDPFYFTDEENRRKRTYIIVEDISSDEPFAQRGHSGAPVFRVEFPEEEPVVMIVSTIIGGPPKRSNKKEEMLSHRMDDALEEVEDKTKTKINIDKSY